MQKDRHRRFAPISVRRPILQRLAIGFCLLSVLGCAASGAKSGNGDAAAVPGHGAGTVDAGPSAPAGRRPFDPVLDGEWIGHAISYGPHRDGQRPGGADPSPDEIREDLAIMGRHWSLLRVYGSRGPAETMLRLIRDDGLAMRVMLGAWVAPEVRRDEHGRVVETLDDAVAANRGEIETAIRLANEYPEIVIAVSVGNETQVSWSAHRSGTEGLIAKVREVRAAVRQPVTTADDFQFWKEERSRAVAREVDFLTVHVHPMWIGEQRETALARLRSEVERVRTAHPGRQVVVGETGWATSVSSEGEQARLIRGRPGETEQKLFHDELRAWVTATRVPTFYFEAFDENWKGGDDPSEVEKHWGLYRADRTPKIAIAGRER